ncbi:hypothetical protein WQ57_15050 [Mesobacillus campisalis]|uniref:YojE n=1 Tax=Mesobacillus campisalis TaxID=1408103 RepID=A0A0M2SRP3_9BACI|nr:hypothetical protein [Mesobacillus campisalis]KKK37269.1 hypothetical protein WQ57_15050 [Mesobacillus campisalis]
MGEIDYTYLLEKYRTLWNNRQLYTEGNAETTLKEAVTRELKDENSHPRVRRSLYEKFYLASKRIIESDLSPDDKIAFLDLHAEMTQAIKEGE